MKPRWPRGKYNGWRIEGFKISFAVHLLTWFFRPIVKWNYGEPFFIWLCFSIRGYREFDITGGTRH